MGYQKVVPQPVVLWISGSPSGRWASIDLAMKQAQDWLWARHKDAEFLVWHEMDMRRGWKSEYEGIKFEMLYCDGVSHGQGDALALG